MKRVDRIDPGALNLAAGMMGVSPPEMGGPQMRPSKQILSCDSVEFYVPCV